MAKNVFTFCDVFAGIGGFRAALEESLDGKCVLSCENDEFAKKAYFNYFGSGNPHVDDVRSNPLDYVHNLPKIDILTAGFPCQSFSFAGNRRALDDNRGALLQDLMRWVEVLRPKSFIFENVPGILTVDGGKALNFIIDSVASLSYDLSYLKMNVKDYTQIPQSRDRVYFVGIDKREVHNYYGFVWPKMVRNRILDFSDFLDKEVSVKYYYNSDSKIAKGINSLGDSLRPTMYHWRRSYARQVKSGLCPTLMNNMGKGGHNVPIVRVEDGIRRLTPEECLRFMGNRYNFFDGLDLSDSAKYSLVGNSVVPRMVEIIAENLLKILNNFKINVVIK